MKLTSSLHDHACASVRFGEVSICELHWIRRDAGIWRRAAVDGGRGPQLLFVLRGELHLSSQGHELLLRSPEWICCDADHVLRAAGEDSRAIILELPNRRYGATRSRGIHCARVGAGSVLLDCIQSALRAGESLSSCARTEIGDLIAELAALALREQSPSVAPPIRRNIMYERVRTFVRQHLRDSSLSIDIIASSLHCTKRYLHKVFRDDGRSLHRFIQDSRLERCGQDLANPALADRSIMGIAVSWGFCSSSHFSRAFRQRFGVAPSLYRSLRMAGTTAAVVAPAVCRARFGSEISSRRPLGHIRPRNAPGPL